MIKYVTELPIVASLGEDETEVVIWESDSNICEMQEDSKCNGLYYGTSDVNEPKLCGYHFYDSVRGDGKTNYKLIPNNQEVTNETTKNSIENLINNHFALIARRINLATGDLDPLQANELDNAIETIARIMDQWKAQNTSKTFTELCAFCDENEVVEEFNGCCSEDCQEKWESYLKTTGRTK